MTFPSMNPDRSERVFYDRADYPAYVRKGRLSAYPDFAADDHWHDDIELIFILSGQMRYHVNGETVFLKEGEGIFINARQLHFGDSQEKKECVFLCVLLHPILLCLSRTVEQKYVSPLLFYEQIPFYHLRGEREWERDVLSSICRIYEVRDEELSELKIQRTFLDIWIALCENVIPMPKEPTAGNRELSALKKMISCINENYGEKLTLARIAAAGNVGKTACCAIFRRYTNKTPNEYLTQFRLRKAMELLKDSDMTVMEISYAVGFSGASYFSEVFRKNYACSPREYRKNPAGEAGKDL